MLDHYGFCVERFEESVRFYENCLPPLGLEITERHAYGAIIIANPNKPDYPFIWIGKGKNYLNSSMNPKTCPLHFAFTAPSKESVDSFFTKGLAFGGTDNGSPGYRDPGYYAAYLLDPNGYNIEACYREPKS